VTAAEPARRHGLFRLAFSLILLAATFAFAGAGDLWSRLALAAAAVCLLQFPWLALRWWLFARWLGVPLGYGQAVGEYTLSTLLNQLLPFGVLGDAMRLGRHVRASGGTPARVALALLLDRASGQLALWLWLIALAPGWWRSSSTAASAPVLALALGALGVAGVAALWLMRRRWQAARALIGEGLGALLSPRRLLLHLPLSLLLVALHVATFALIARSLAFELPLSSAARVVPPVLVAATLPAAFAGWGAREAAAAGLFAASGLRAADGALVSLIFGALGLLTSTPGLLFWLGARPGQRHST